MKIGVLISMGVTTDILKEMQKVKSTQLDSCQICIFDTAVYTEENAERVLAASRETGVEVSTVWAGWSQPGQWDLINGPLTLGLVPAAYRYFRSQEVLAAVPFAQRIGVKQIATHVGFMPENPHDPDYMGTICILRHICACMKEKGITFLFETGQETPVTLLRAIEDIGADNVGINFDTANLVLYGKGNPVDALRVFGKYVRDLHIKDGLYPTDGRHLGKEVPAGEGIADFPTIVKMLKELGYTGAYTIEREIDGDRQTQDIIRARDMLLDIESSLGA